MDYNPIQEGFDSVSNDFSNKLILGTAQTYVPEVFKSDNIPALRKESKISSIDPLYHSTRGESVFEEL